ncbi:MAG: PAS domain S-box protein [Candidatus Obscuribacterales bacterium]|nr:PAS domain S-box protein [Candidatus Obscuribacterales bacterium]
MKEIFVPLCKTGMLKSTAKEEPAVFEMDQCGFITSWSKKACELYGYEKDEIVGQHFSILFDVSDLQHGKASQALRKAQQQGWHTGVVWQNRKNGQRFRSYYEKVALRDALGLICGYKNTVVEQPAEE